MMNSGTVLVMAGAREAHTLAASLRRRGRKVIVSLPAAERAFEPFTAPVRIGPFPSKEAMADWMAAQGVRTVIDASHAFDVEISRDVSLICKVQDLRYLRVLRPPWRQSRQDIWLPYRSIAKAAQDVPAGERVFTNTGRATLNEYRGFRGDVLFVRQTQLHDEAAPFAFAHYVFGTPPFSQGGEESLFTELNISRLICRNVGGPASMSKLLAARRLGLPVAMIERPQTPAWITRVDSVNEALAWEANA
ncbi:precorrin-6A/cobalt-precorrin-6A reductase [Roseobacter cerasinus]|nr:precorrin-6A/cobalt-precorrin-6A reductase [Roseobacter cerasinus]